MARTVFVNPTKPRRRRRRSSKRVVAKAAPRKVRRTRRRRRNAGIVPFTSSAMAKRSNPLILSNPRRRRSRRRNPGLPNLKQAASQVMSYTGGAAIGAGLNILAFRHISNPWIRNGARVLAALGGGMFLSSTMGGAMAGATLYPTIAELAMMLGLGGDTTTEADLNELAADLEAALEDVDATEPLYVP